jgi:hypothetical protein
MFRPSAPHRTPTISRAAWLCVAVGAIMLGLASRRFGASLPPFLAAYSGDTLWALLVFALTGLLAPRAPIGRRAVASLAFAFAIECSQLFHAEWIDAIRATTLGALVLGHGFLWSDLACYTVGVATGAVMAVAMERFAARRA